MDKVLLWYMGHEKNKKVETRSATSVSDRPDAGFLRLTLADLLQPSSELNFKTAKDEQQVFSLAEHKNFMMENAFFHTNAYLK